MEHSSQQNNKIQTIIFFAFAFLSFFVFPRESFAACQLESGQFRNQDYGINFPLTWFANSVTQTGSQPFIYLDLKFHPDCLGNNSVSFSVQEHDTLYPNVNASGSFTIPTFTNETLEQTHIFTAGDTGCDVWYLGGYGCEYFLLLEIDGEENDYSSTNLLNIEYNCSGDCFDQMWAYMGTAHVGNTAGYTYGAYVSSNDPDLQNFQQQSQGDGDTQTTEQGDGTVQTTEQGDGGIAIGGVGNLEDIENPLGPGSNLPAFIESLLGILVRAGIPLVVLALVYTGFRFVEARGNPTKIAEAKQLLLYTVIGTAILLGAWTITTILTNTLNLIIASSIIHIV